MSLTLIHFRTKQWLWAGLANAPLSRLVRRFHCSYSSDVYEIHNGDKKLTVRGGKSRSKQTKKLPIRKKIERTSKKMRTSVSDVALDLDEVNQTKNWSNAAPPLSFPFDGSSYTQIDDEVNMCHCASVDLHYSANSSLVQRIDNYRSEGRFYRVLSSAGAGVILPSVTTVLNNTLTRSQYYRLQNWKKNMIQQHGEEQFENIQQRTKSAGTNFHQKLEKKLLKLQLPDSISIKPHLSENEEWSAHSMPSIVKKDTKTTPTEEFEKNLAKTLKLCQKPVSKYIRSVEHVLKQISCVLALESVVIHRELGYTGTCDCVAKYRDEVCLIDWKSSEKPKPTVDDCYDFPLQAVAYAGAINHDDQYPFKVFNILIVVAYADGAPAHAHFLPYKKCQYYWSKWLHRLQEYQTQFASDHSNIMY